MTRVDLDLSGRRLVTAKNAAKTLGRHEITLAKWRMDGTGPRYFKICGRIFYDLADIDGFIEAQARISTSDAPLHAVA